MHKRALTLIVFGVAVGVGCRTIEQPRRHYDTYASAVAAGESSRGWLPAWVPPTATDLFFQNNIDTNELWLRFRLDKTAADSIQQFLRTVPADEVTISSPARASDWWFEGLIEQEPANDAALYAYVFRGTGNPVPQSTVIAFDKASPLVYVWTSQLK